MTSQLVTAFVERLDGDEPFSTALEHDPFATLRNEGFADLAAAAEQDRDRIGELVARATTQATVQVAPQLTAQVAPQQRVQVAPQVKAQVKPAAKVQVSRQDRTQWHGVQPQLARAQFASFLGIHRSGR